MNNLFEVRNLSLYYDSDDGPIRAVNDVSFSVRRKGEAIGIVGESGSGKSSLALALIRALPANVVRYDGEILLNGLDIMQMHEAQFREQIRGNKIGMIFQGVMNSLNPVLRVGFQIIEKSVSEGVFSKKQAYIRAEDLLKVVGLPKGTLDRYPHELSGGMKQRVIIAMALMMDPQILILDEPTSALDVSVQAQLLNMLKDLKFNADMAMIFITHDIALATDICDRIMVSYGGEYVEQGDIESVLLSPKHPYTQKLIASIPSLHGSVKPEFLEGNPPDLAYKAGGCQFAPRCPQAVDFCSHNIPMHFVVGADHQAKCWLYR